MFLTFEDITICARTVYGEARGEDQHGRICVAWVMINRWRKTTGQFSKDHTLAAACLRWMQFSAWNPNDPNRQKMMEIDCNDPVFRECLRSVLFALNTSDPTFGALHYKTKTARPRWARGHVPCYVHGAHQFYNDVA